MKSTWRTLWQQHDLVVFRDEKEVDRFASERIERVFLLHRGEGDTPGDIGLVVVQLDDGYAMFEPETGFAGRVNFERQAFWRSRACVYWVHAASARMPWRFRLPGFAAAPRAAYRVVPRSELDAQVAAWSSLEGPQTWDERKLWRIEKRRPFGFAAQARAHA